MFSVSTGATELRLFTEEFPPYNFLEQESVVGINADLLSQACQLANISCTFELSHWNRAMNSARSKPNMGVFSASRTEKRENDFLWVGPIVFGNSCFYRLKSREDIAINDVSAITNYTVGIARNDVYEAVLLNMGFQKGKNYITYSSKHQDTRMFKEGKLDLLIGSSMTLASQLNNVGLKPEDVVPVSELNDDSLVGNYLALNKESDADVVIKLQSAIDALKANGELEKIITKYVGVSRALNQLMVSPLKMCTNGAANY